MAGRPRCESANSAGGSCRAAPLHGGTLCFWHDPQSAAEAAAARRLGGQRRRHEQITAGAYDIEALETPDDVRRVIEIAVIETLGLPNAVPRNRTLLWSSAVFLKFLEVGHLEERLQAVEATLRPPRKQGRTR
jgi:hypothetical protein